jgi:hypothetical protein
LTSENSAGLGKGSATTEIEDLYRDALAELGITSPGRREAVRWWLGELAKELVQGQDLGRWARAQDRARRRVDGRE